MCFHTLLLQLSTTFLVPRSLLILKGTKKIRRIFSNYIFGEGI